MSQISIDVARDLFAHMEWADAHVWRAMVAKPEVLNDERLMKLVHHLHLVHRAFFMMWNGEAISSEEFYAIHPPEELRAAARPLYARMDEFVAASESRLNERVHMPWLQHFEKQLGTSLQSPTFGETFLQLPMHSTYHRGQVNARLRELGAEPPLVDYIAWIWFGRPSPEWP
jgi:uncharacterized damage-inducible protein DinB